MYDSCSSGLTRQVSPACRLRMLGTGAWGARPAGLRVLCLLSAAECGYGGGGRQGRQRVAARDTSLLVHVRLPQVYVSLPHVSDSHGWHGGPWEPRVMNLICSDVSALEGLFLNCLLQVSSERLRGGLGVKMLAPGPKEKLSNWPWSRLWGRGGLPGSGPGKRRAPMPTQGRPGTFK